MKCHRNDKTSANLRPTVCVLQQKVSILSTFLHPVTITQQFNPPRTSIHFRNYNQQTKIQQNDQFYSIKREFKAVLIDVLAT